MGGTGLESERVTFPRMSPCVVLNLSMLRVDSYVNTPMYACVVLFRVISIILVTLLDTRNRVPTHPIEWD